MENVKPIYSATWCINAPWAHPAWSWYTILLVDLITPHADGPPHIHRDGATHEMTLWALHPDNNHKYRQGKLLASHVVETLSGNLLRPISYGYQFTAEDNNAAEQRCQSIFNLISERKLNPDTDYRAVWDSLYDDWTPLVRSAW